MIAPPAAWLDNYASQIADRYFRGGPSVARLSPETIAMGGARTARYRGAPIQADVRANLARDIYEAIKTRI